MKSSLEKFGRKLTTMHKKDNQSSAAHLDELVQASKVIMCKSRDIVG